MYRVLPLLLAVVALALFVAAPAVAQEKGGAAAGKEYTVKKYDPTTRTLTVTDAGGKERTLNLGADTKFMGKTTKAEDLKSGDRITVTESGGKVTEIRSGAGADKPRKDKP